MAYTAVASHQPTALREFLRRHAPPAVAGTSYAAMFSLRIGMPPRQPQLSFFGLDGAPEPTSPTARFPALNARDCRSRVRRRPAVVVSQPIRVAAIPPVPR